ncbi:MAG: reverse transcriptase/maturase family protein [Nanoarchaeota archaeon]
MKTYNHLWQQLCTYEHLKASYDKAKEGKTYRASVQKFEEHYEEELSKLLIELQNKTYTPQLLKQFILRDPKTRKICVSDFRDRVVHHALINIIHPIFDPKLVYDSYASRVGKGTSLALRRFDQFKRKVTKNNTKSCYIFKADIKHYFQTVDQEILLDMIKKYIKDENVLWLIRKILNNYHGEEEGKGMPLGNWTSQFFANIYLNELDQFVKHKLKAKYYIRYVDDFIILHQSKETLIIYETKINKFLKALHLELHPDKCKIVLLQTGIRFLGFKNFYHHRIILRRNKQKIYARINSLLDGCSFNVNSKRSVLKTFYGWSGYARLGNSFNFRRKLIFHIIENL